MSAFPSGAFAQYVPASSELIVRNTPDAIDLIDSLVDAAIGVQPTQVEIESKFLEITQNNIKELGFDWLLGPLAIGSTGAFAAGGTQGFGSAPQPRKLSFYSRRRTRWYEPSNRGVEIGHHRHRKS